MHAIDVGKLLIPGRTNWPEVNEFNYYNNMGWTLMLRFKNLSAKGIWDVKQGEAEFALATYEHAIFKHEMNPKSTE